MCPEFPQWFRLFSKKTWFGASLWVVVAVVLWFSEGPSINTGDWDRVTVPAGFGSMPFCVELDNLKDTDAPIHQPAAMLVAAD